jgi:hypothetical protein
MKESLYEVHTKMNSNYYQIYLSSCLDLIQTLVIKSTETARLINEYLDLQIANANQSNTIYYNPVDETTWKYYLNLSGQYLEPFDKVIYIKSLDTLQDIKFTPENLQNNPLTLQAYQYGTNYYLKLVSDYPDQIPLINSILYPCDINTAIAAPNGAILAYNKNLVESNEYTLISDLQIWIDRFQFRWNNQPFQITDSLYTVSYLAILYLNLVPELMNIRLRKAKTPEAHSFHVTQYLASHNGLNAYTNQFTLGQKLYLYRNINYIQRHAGFQSTFQALIDDLIIPSGINLVSYKIVHTGFDAKDDPIISLRKYSLTNPSQPFVYYTIGDVLSEESVLYDNANYTANYNTNLLAMVQSTRYTKLPTKVVKTDTTTNIPLVEHTKQSTVMNAWLYLAVKGMYTATITFIDPISQINYTLSATDAYLYMLYVEATALGVSLEYVPPAIALRAPVLNYQGIKALTALIDSNNVPTSNSDIAYILSKQVTIEPLPTVDAFQTYCDALYKVIEEQDIYVNSIGDIDRKAQYKIMIDQFYVDEIVDFPDTYESISNWLKNKRLPIFSYSANQAQSLINAIVEAATGHNYNINKGININNSLVSLVQKLSSYNLQYLITSNSTTIFIIENVIGINSNTLKVDYADSTGQVFATDTYLEGYSSYASSGFIGYQLYLILSGAQKNTLTDIYSA